MPSSFWIEEHLLCDPIPGYALEDFPEIYGDEIQREVRWRNGSSVQKLARHTVRLKISIRDADLYSTLQAHGGPDSVLKTPSIFEITITTP